MRSPLNFNSLRRGPQNQNVRIPQCLPKDDLYGFSDPYKTQYDVFNRQFQNELELRHHFNSLLNLVPSDNVQKEAVQLNDLSRNHEQSFVRNDLRYPTNVNHYPNESSTLTRQRHSDKTNVDQQNRYLYGNNPYNNENSSESDNTAHFEILEKNHQKPSGFDDAQRMMNNVNIAAENENNHYEPVRNKNNEDWYAQDEEEAWAPVNKQTSTNAFSKNGAWVVFNHNM